MTLKYKKQAKFFKNEGNPAASGSNDDDNLYVEFYVEKYNINVAFLFPTGVIDQNDINAENLIEFDQNF